MTGIRQRHSRACRSRDGARCNCKPSYEAWVYLKREDRKVRKTFPTLAAAKTWRTDALRASNRGQLRAPTALTVRQAAEELIGGMRDGSIPTRSGSRYKPSAVRSYDEALRLRILPALGDRRLSDVTRADVQDIADRLTAEGLAASTVSNQLDPLRVIYRRAIRRDLVSVDPTKGLELRKPDGRRDRIASPEEARELLDALHESDRAIWATALYAGLRLGELRALRWTDVGLDARVIRVERGWDAKEGEQAGKSAAARRTVPLIGRLAPYLAVHKLATGRDGDALVFGATAEVPFEPSTVNRRALAAWGWKSGRNPDPEGPRTIALKAREDALDRIGLHECRHTFASLLIASGGEREGHLDDHGTCDHRDHLRHLRSPAPRRRGRGARSARQLPRPARRWAAPARGGVRRRRSGRPRAPLHGSVHGGCARAPGPLSCSVLLPAVRPHGCTGGESFYGRAFDTGRRLHRLAERLQDRP
jgi:integrase